MTFWQAVAAIASALIAPAALIIQQRQQNRRESEREQREAETRASEAAQTRSERVWAERREAYAAVLRAAHRFRAERAPVMLRLHEARRVSFAKNPIKDVLTTLPGPTSSLGALHEAIGDALLWAGRGAVAGAVTELRERVEGVESCLVPSDLTLSDAFTAWIALDHSITSYAERASEDLGDHP